MLELAAMYVAIDQCDPFVMHFGSEKYHFRVAVGADGTPFGKDDEATAWLISFLSLWCLKHSGLFAVVRASL